VVAEIVAQLLNKVVIDCIPIVRELGLSLEKLCLGLLSEHDALILVLDDIPDLMTIVEYSAWFKIDDQPAGVVLDQAAKERRGMELIDRVITPVLPIPGLVLYMTGRSPQQAYKLLTTNSCSPLLAMPVLLDALSLSDIEEIILAPTAYTQVTQVPLSDSIGLRDHKEVTELAQFLLFQTGGVPRVVTEALSELETMKWLLPENRPANKSLFEILDAHTKELRENVQVNVKYGLAPNWSSRISGWDQEMTKTALVEVLWATRELRILDSSYKVTVAKDLKVTAVDLLSVLGIPYKLKSGNKIQVQVGAWLLSSLLEEKTVAWTPKEILQVLAWLKPKVDGGADAVVVALMSKAGHHAYAYLTTAAIAMATAGVIF
jgi:hypothetical protein